MLNALLIWWILLCAISIINIFSWGISTFFLAGNRNSKADSFILRKYQIFLSAFFVFGCAFRSVLPRIDVERIALFHSWLSSIFIGRSVATIAEICFIIQISLVLNLIGRRKKSNFIIVISWLIVPLISIAEFFSWYSILTTSYFGNIIEESIWTLAFILILIAIAVLWIRRNFMYRKILLIAILVIFSYIVFMITVDVPMYILRYDSDQFHGKIYLSLSEGAKDAWSHRIVSYQWNQWKSEIPWMSLYFSIAVWISIALINTSILENI